MGHLGKHKKEQFVRSFSDRAERPGQSYGYGTKTTLPKTGSGELNTASKCLVLLLFEEAMQKN